MSEVDIEGQVIPHLRGQFERATVILFTGAGFSIGAKNILGSEPPLGGALKKELWPLCFPSEPFDDSTSLQDVYHTALVRRPKDLSALLSQLYAIDPDSLPGWYQLLLSLPWLRCYTLNIDDLFSAAGRKFELPRRARELSAVKQGVVPMDEPSQVLDVVHLNGIVTDGPEHLTFTVPQYARRIGGPEPWYVRATADLLSNSFVFIGTQLDEPPLWQHIELRRSKGGRGLRELRPKSYLISPRLDLARRALLSDFNVVWIPMKTDEFVRDVIGPLEGAARRGHEHLGQLAIGRKSGEAALPEVASLAQNPGQASDFLLGQEPVWADLQSGRAILRESDEAIWNEVQAAQRKSDAPRGVLVISGTAGSGKSTALMRVCLRLVAKGTRVGWIDRDTELSPRDIRQAMTGQDVPRVLAIDDADMYGSELASITREVALGEGAPLVLLAIRASKVERVLKPERLEGIPLSEHVMPHLADSDIAGLLDVLDRENRLGALKGRARSEQEAVFREKAGRQLLVAMIEATSNQRFEEKALNEFFELDEHGQRVYALIAVAYAQRFSLTRDEILIASGDPTNEALNVIDQLVRRRIVSSGTGKREGLQARHRVIAEIIFDELQKRRLLRDIVSGLAFLAATKVGPHLRRSARPWRLLRWIINHDFLARVVGPDDARAVYDGVESPLSWDYHYYLQRGSLEVEFGDLSLAENFLSQARSLAENDPLVETEWAYLLFRKSLETPGTLESAARVEEATAILEELIARRGVRDYYPYHVLGSQGLAWARRGVVGSDAKGRYLEKLIKCCEDGLKKHSRQKDLQQLLSDLRREYLSIAVGGRSS